MHLQQLRVQSSRRPVPGKMTFGDPTNEAAEVAKREFIPPQVRIVEVQNAEKVFTACEGTIKAKEDDIKEALIEYHSEVLGQLQLRKKKPWSEFAG